MDKPSVKIPATLRRFSDKIWAVDDERATRNGWWVYLKVGWVYDGVHQIHEDTLRECAVCFDMVKPCDCADCKSLLISEPA